MPVWFEFLLAFVWWVLLLPLFLVFATPYIFIASFFGEGACWEKVKVKYRKVVLFWEKWGWGFSL
ncbi:MAG: hypothetical protein Q7J84_03700 [Sulfuricaulis sp.]|nr:hypothetical protein [Sulfuricaulis sp.]